MFHINEPLFAPLLGACMCVSVCLCVHENVVGEMYKKGVLAKHMDVSMWGFVGL